MGFMGLMGLMGLIEMGRDCAGVQVAARVFIKIFP